MRWITIVFGLMYILVSTFAGLLKGFFIQDVCTGTGPGSYNFTRLCGPDFISYVWLFAAVSFLFIAGLLVFIISMDTVRPLIRYTAFAIFVIYGLMVFSAAIWDAPFFAVPNYPQAVNPNCLECSQATPTPS